MGKVISICLISMFVVISCKKDKLDDNREQLLTHRWVWTHSYHTYGLCDSLVSTDTLSQQTIHDYLIVDFREKGKVIFYENNEVTKKRIVFTSKDTSVYNSLLFEIHLNNNPDDVLKGGVKDDILWLNSFPYKAEVEGCDVYVNYFSPEIY